MQPSVSRDPNIRAFIRHHRVDIVTSSYVLETLFQNHGPAFREPWDIPVRVIEHTDREGLPHSVAYMEDPLLAPSLSMRVSSGDNLLVSSLDFHARMRIARTTSVRWSNTARMSLPLCVPMSVAEPTALKAQNLYT